MIYTYIYMYVRTRIHVRTYVYVYIYAHMYAFVRAHLHEHPTETGWAWQEACAVQADERAEEEQKKALMTKMTRRFLHASLTLAFERWQVRLKFA